MTRALLRSARLVLLVALPACVPQPLPLPAPLLQSEPAPEEVERVLFLLGDAGQATTATSPLLQRLQSDVEEWSGRLASDSATAVLVLGDVVYPIGVHPPESSWFAHDTAIVMSQARLVGGPTAVRRGAAAYFVAGNHDWGLRQDFAGAVRLLRLQEVLEAARVTMGAAGYLVPTPGTGGPWVLDWGQHVRLLFLDTAWWLLGADEEEELLFLQQIEEAMETAGDRKVVFVAHHPFRAVGPHGGEVDFWETFGIYSLLQKAGVLLQDLNSRPYRELDSGLRAIFARTGPPFAFIGGHEHSLQVIERVEATDPLFNLVSGSGSKLSEVGVQPGLRYAASVPGYMRLLIERDGGMHLSVIATPERYLLCPEGDPRRRECMTEGLAAFRVIHSQRLR